MCARNTQTIMRINNQCKMVAFESHQQNKVRNVFIDELTITVVYTTTHYGISL